MRKLIFLIGLLGCATLSLTPLSVSAKAKDSVMKRLLQEKAVRKQKYMRKNRLALSLITGSSTNDRFVRSYFVGGGVEYYLKDSFGIGVNGSMGILSELDLVSQIQSIRPSLGDLKYFQGIGTSIGGELIFVPAFGKVSVLGFLNAKYDFQFTAGVNLIGLQSVANGGVYDRTTIAPQVGGGLRLFFSNQIALNLQLKDLIYARSESILPSDLNAEQHASESASWQNHFIFHIAFNFFLGKPTIGR